MAARISVELGLHIDSQANLVPTKMNPDMLRLRKGLYWALQATDV